MATSSPDSLSIPEVSDKDASGFTSLAPSINQARGVRNEAPKTAASDPESVKAGLDFKPTWRFYLTFISISVITLAAALDATSKSYPAKSPHLS